MTIDSPRIPAPPSLRPSHRSRYLHLRDYYPTGREGASSPRHCRFTSLCLAFVLFPLPQPPLSLLDMGFLWRRRLGCLQAGGTVFGWNVLFSPALHGATLLFYAELSCSRLDAALLLLEYWVLPPWSLAGRLSGWFPARWPLHNMGCEENVVSGMVEDTGKAR
ncbi:hypothetical protein VTI74DRAFT_9688 [Chaetomium olivicolor]